MSDEKRDTPTSSLTQAGDIVDTFWDIKPIEFPRLDGDEETSTLPPQDGSDTTTPFGELPVFSGPDQTDESTTESASDNAGADDFAADMVAQPVIPERKINPWLIVTIVATVVIIISLVIGGLVYWNSLKKDDAHSTAMSQCLSSSDNYTKASEKLSKALENSKSVQAITDGQVADAATVSTLKSAVTEANSIGKAASCNYIAPTASLSKSAKSNRALTAKLESSAKAVTTAAKAVTKSQEQKKIDTAKQKLQSAVSDAQQTLADSDGAVSDESTRDSLQKALDDANALLKQSNPKAADLEKSLTNLQDATKAVKSSMDDFTALVASCKFVSDFSRSAAFGLDCLSNAFASSSAFCRESRVLSSETAPSLSANVCWASETADCSFCLAVSIFFCSWLFVTALAAVVTALALLSSLAVNARLLLADLLREAVGAI